MKTALLTCDCDCVVEMEEMGIGAREILQYTRAVLSRRGVRALMEGLECTFCEEDPTPAPSDW